MANILAFALSIAILWISINGSAAGRCTRLENAKRHLRQGGDGGYRIFIDGDPKGYQPNKIYNGLSFFFPFFQISYQIKAHSVLFPQYFW